MVETESDGGNSAAVSLYKTILAWIIDNKFLFAIILLVVLTALIPLYGVLFPPNVDFPEHILVSKLLWDKLTGVTNFDLEIPTYLGYKLSPLFLVSVRAFCQIFGIPFIYLPQIVATLLIVFHATVVVTILYRAMSEKTWKSYGFAFCFMLPAVVCVYSACWFIGFIGFGMAITLLIPAIFLTERFVSAGRLTDGILLFTLLFLVYAAHPFAVLFWLIWCFSRALVSLATRSFAREWKRLMFLGVISLPIFVYNFIATAGTELALSGRQYLYHAPLLSASKWYETRLGPLLNGSLLKADAAAEAKIFALFGVGFVLVSTFLIFRITKNCQARKLVLSSTFFLLICSAINEKFIPTPIVHWLAWDYRYSSTVFAVCLAVASFVLIRFLPLTPGKLGYKVAFLVLAVISVVASVDHLFEVRKANARFDAPAREYMAKVFSGESPAGITLPESRWHPDRSLIRLYICLDQPDCNPDGSTFKEIGGILYAVKFKSSGNANAANGSASSANAFIGGRGNAIGQFARPRGVAADSNGNIYVADSDNSRVQKFDRTGVYISAFGTQGFGEGELREPNGIAVDIDGFIYVADAARNKLIRFNPAGTFVKEWKCPDRGFYKPRDLAIGPDKQLYVVDQGFARIVKFDPATEKFTSWEMAGEGEGRSRELTGLAIGGGFVFVADNGNNLIQVLSLDGKFIREWKVPSWEAAFRNYPDTAFDEKKKVLYVTNGRTGELLAFDIDGNAIDHGFKQESVNNLENPSSLFISDTEAGRVLYILNTSGSRLTAVNLDPI